MPNSFRFSYLCCAVALASLGFPGLDASQTISSNRLPMWEEARKPAAKGTHVRFPKDILVRLRSAAELIAPCDREESAKIDAYRVTLNSRSPAVAIIAWGRGFCYCGATGNCQFWVFVNDHGKNRPVLETDMVRDFGFLKAKTNGYRDLAVWSHDSAMRSPARLFQFNGKEYLEECGWQEEYEFQELPNGISVQVGAPRIIDNTCSLSPTRLR
jgi:hypothetical protein